MCSTKTRLRACATSLWAEPSAAQVEVLAGLQEGERLLPNPVPGTEWQEIDPLGASNEPESKSKSDNTACTRPYAWRDTLPTLSLIRS